MEIKRKILNKLGLFTRDDVNEITDKLGSSYDTTIARLEEEFKSKIKSLKCNHKETIDVIEVGYKHTIKALEQDMKDYQKLVEKDKKTLQDRIESLDNEKTSFINEISIKNSEIATLNKQIDELKETMSHMYTLEELRAQKAPKQKRKTKSSSRLSEIARKSAMEIE